MLDTLLIALHAKINKWYFLLMKNIICHTVNTSFRKNKYFRQLKEILLRTKFSKKKCLSQIVVNISRIYYNFPVFINEVC